MTQMERINAICFYLIELAQESNATKITIMQENVVRDGASLGNWRLTLEKVDDPEADCPPGCPVKNGSSDRGVVPFWL